MRMQVEMGRRETERGTPGDKETGGRIKGLLETLRDGEGQTAIRPQ